MVREKPVKGIRTLKIVFFKNRVISDISVLLRERTLIILDSTGKLVSMESEIVLVLSLSTTEISEITRLKIRSSWSRYLEISTKSIDSGHPAQSAQADLGRKFLLCITIQ